MTQMVCISFTEDVTPSEIWPCRVAGTLALVTGGFHQRARVTESLLFIRGKIKPWGMRAKETLFLTVLCHSFPKDRACGLNSAHCSPPPCLTHTHVPSLNTYLKELSE